MSEKKNIDRLFQEKFKDFEAKPSDHLWEGIEARLKKDKKRRVIPIWFRLAGVAAALLIGWLIFDGYNAAVSYPDNGIVTTEGDTLNPNETDARPEAPIPSEFETSDSSRSEIVSTEPTDDNSSGEYGTTNEAHKSRRTNSRTSGSVASNGVEQQSQRVEQQQSGGKSNSAISENSNVGIASADEKQKDDTKTASDRVENREINQSQEQNTDAIADADRAAGADQNKNNIPEDALASDEIIKDTTAIATVVPNTLEELLNEKENKTVTEEQKVSRWQLSSNVAPVYFSSTSNGSPIDDRFASNAKDFKQNLSYGLGVRYALNDKFAVRMGINTISMEYLTRDVIFSQSSSSARLTHVNTNPAGDMMQIESKNNVAGAIELAVNNVPVKKFDASLSQRTGYVEIPLELSYKVLDNKFGIEVIGGVSTLFLNENTVTIESSGTAIEIGKANNLNDTHFSTNIGLGFRYNFSRSFEFKFEPMLKYQINTFSSSGNFQPYFFGLYTGLNYRF